MRDTDYATELCQPAVLTDEYGEARLERLRLKQTGEVVIRLSWWKDKTIGLDRAGPDHATREGFPARRPAT